MMSGTTVILPRGVIGATDGIGSLLNLMAGTRTVGAFQAVQSITWERIRFRLEFPD
jgi:hypothetical protein